MKKWIRNVGMFVILMFTVAFLASCVSTSAERRDRIIQSGHLPNQTEKDLRFWTKEEICSRCDQNADKVKISAPNTPKYADLWEKTKKYVFFQCVVSNLAVQYKVKNLPLMPFSEDFSGAVSSNPYDCDCYKEAERLVTLYDIDPRIGEEYIKYIIAQCEYYKAAYAAGFSKVTKTVGKPEKDFTDIGTAGFWN